MDSRTGSDGRSPPSDGAAGASETRHGTAALALGAVGVVYGDIGTSPIYALREAIRAVAGDRSPAEDEVLGVLSIIVWSLTLIVSIKYALFVLRADNRGEGGTLSLMALARRNAGSSYTPAIILLGLFGAALFYGDAIITPAISVLSAVEGLEVVAPGLSDYVIPITLVILVSLFSVQRLGTARVASVFGPITALWFLVLAGIGLYHVAANPAVLWALNPAVAVGFLVNNGGVALVVMGAAFLAVTGAEALYADLGHFGRRPIVLAWFSLVFPSLLLNYFGQGAYVLSHAGPVGQPLFQMVPAWMTLPLVVLATIATVIASQAVISGAYSLTRQAIQMQFLPRLDVLHTSETLSGQIYMPQVNLLLLIGVVILVLEFGSSSALASAYGISVTGEMIVTALLLFFVIWKIWKRSALLAAVVVLPFLVLDVTFLWANALKILDGGWISVAVAALLVLVMLTWRRGSRLLFDKTRKTEVPLTVLTDNLARKVPTLVEGTAVFLTSDPESAPTALMHSLKHYHVLHKNNVILSVVTTEQPRIPEDERVEMEMLNPLFMRVRLNFGYMEQPNVPKALAICRKLGWKFDIMTTSFFLSRRSLKASEQSGMPVWQDKLFIALARNASDASVYFRLPTGRVVEIGTQVTV
ncbi:potassium transporter Kup [Aquamicrobium sp. LC103]|uniref:potassium transporter Kup n=1 Tax=Aquamicrobium sp. LC103 TaxID=1120658 RepID=UPI00063EA9F1|nr:potassium transporter Kup [Aquamicrobium sp. LC103]TKT80089.1 potassium transporter Kup [Aquamicrobium sp. LC103]